LVLLRTHLAFYIASASTADLAIHTSDLRVDYGDTVAVRGIDLRIPKGEVYGLVGPNGAGKTSTFRVLATLMEPTYGDVFVCGHDAALHRSRVRQKLAYMPDLAPLPSDLKCWEFLELFAGAYGLRGQAGRDRIDECLDRVELTEKRDAMCKTLSRGMTQRLVLAKTLLHRPAVMILDEPASGLDPVRRARLRTTVREVAGEGRTVIISSHILSELADMCTSIGLMKDGNLIDSGPVDEVIDRLSGSTRQLRIRIAGQSHQVQDWLRQKLGADLVVETERGTLSFPFEGSESDQADLLVAMVSSGFRPSSFEVGRSSIEDIFLDLSAPEGVQ